MAVIKVIPLTSEQLVRREELRREMVVAEHEATRTRVQYRDFEQGLAGIFIKSGEHYNRRVEVVDDCAIVLEEYSR